MCKPFPSRTILVLCRHPVEERRPRSAAIAEAILPATRAMLAPFSVKEYSERETYPFLLYMITMESREP